MWNTKEGLEDGGCIGIHARGMRRALICRQRKTKVKVKRKPYLLYTITHPVTMSTRAETHTAAVHLEHRLVLAVVAVDVVVVVVGVGLDCVVVAFRLLGETTANSTLLVVYVFARPLASSSW